MTDVNRIDVKEFVDLGFLQEANRQFFHPLGLALEVVIEDDGTYRLGGIWDYRDDPEGIYFADGMIDPEKTRRVQAEFYSHDVSRSKLFGDPIQSK